MGLPWEAVLAISEPQDTAQTQQLTRNTAEDERKHSADTGEDLLCQYFVCSCLSLLLVEALRKQSWRAFQKQTQEGIHF